mmetsp:Transcript_14475/g.37294  ORF Transcript_14475/g.37294 Transcript_14475/m.37294 type:complete len:320 (+) Transcript_14475:1318-2277(+)
MQGAGVRRILGHLLGPDRKEGEVRQQLVAVLVGGGAEALEELPGQDQRLKGARLLPLGPDVDIGLPLQLRQGRVAPLLEVVQADLLRLVSVAAGGDRVRVPLVDDLEGVVGLARVHEELHGLVELGVLHAAHRGGDDDVLPLLLVWLELGEDGAAAAAAGPEQRPEGPALAQELPQQVALRLDDRHVAAPLHLRRQAVVLKRRRRILHSEVLPVVVHDVRAEHAAARPDVRAEVKGPVVAEDDAEVHRLDRKGEGALTLHVGRGEGRQVLDARLELEREEEEDGVEQGLLAVPRVVSGGVLRQLLLQLREPVRLLVLVA